MPQPEPGSKNPKENFLAFPLETGLDRISEVGYRISDKIYKAALSGFFI